MKILMPTSGAQLWKPTWNKTRTVFRVFPGRDPENPDSYDPFRFTEKLRDVGNWIRDITAVTLGERQQQVTFITRNPRANADVEDNPASWLFRAISKGVKSGLCPGEWNPLVLGGGKDGPAPLSMPKNFYLMQGVLVEHRSKSFETKTGLKGVGEDDTVVLMISKAAGDKLLNDFLMQTDNDDKFVYKDITDLKDGWFFGLSQNDTQWPGDAAASMGSVPASEFPYYDCRLLKSWSANDTEVPLEVPQDLVDSKTKLWEDILYFPTLSEQLELICDSGIPHGALKYAFEDRYGENEDLPNRVLRIINPDKFKSTAAPEQPMLPVAAEKLEIREAAPVKAVLGAEPSQADSAEDVSVGDEDAVPNRASAVEALERARDKDRRLETQQ